MVATQAPTRDGHVLFGYRFSSEQGDEMGNQAADRSGYIDAIKGAAILLVIFGHLIEQNTGLFGLLTLYNIIYSFHMPLFIFLAGLYARPEMTRADARKLLERVVAPLVVFHVLYTVYAGFFPRAYTYGWTDPYWHLWFLLSLATWRVLLPLACSPMGLVVATLVAVAIGNAPQIGTELSLARSAYFFPFFIAGALFGRQLVSHVQSARGWYAPLLLICGVVIAVWTQFGLHPYTLRGSIPFELAKPLTNEPEVGRLLLMILAFAGLVGFAAIIPDKSRILEYLGRNVIAIYLLHAFLVLPFREFIAPHLSSSIVAIVISVAAAALIAAISAPLRHPVEKLMEWVGSITRFFNDLFGSTRQDWGQFSRRMRSPRELP